MSPAALSKHVTRVKLMDSGSCFLPVASASSASAFGPLPAFAPAPPSTADASGYEIPVGDWIWDSSDLWHYQIITAHVEPSGDGYVAVCREGSAATPLLKAFAWSGWLAASVAAGIFLPGGWAVLLILALLFFSSWVVLRPSQKSVRRMLRLAERFHG